MPIRSIDWWSLFLLLTAFVVSVLASYTMFNFIRNLRRTNKSFRFFWLAGGVFVFGFGLLTKHFMTTLALHLPLRVDWSLLLISLSAVLLALLTFVMLMMPDAYPNRLPLGSLILSVGIAFPTYFWTPGLDMVNFYLDPGPFALSITILLAGVYGSLLLAERPRSTSRWPAGLTLGCTLMAAQLIGVSATRENTDIAPFEESWRMDFQLLSVIVGICALMILLCSMVIWYIDKRLNQMDERYRAVVENSLDTIAIVKKNAWMFVNRAGVRLFEAESEKDLLGKSIYQFLPESQHEAVRERLNNLPATGSSGPLEQQWYTLQGNTIDTEVVETHMMLDNEPVVQMIIRDISERKKNEELLINSEKLYVAGQLAAGIAHEIRNPLTALKGFLQLLASGKAYKAAYFEIMHSELDRISDIVSELLMLSKPQVYDLTHLDVRNAIRETMTLLESQAILHNITIETKAGPEPLWVYGVSTQIKQVFINIIKNAIEAMKDGGIIRIDLAREGDYVLVRITDQGPGINEEQIAKIGQPFYTTKEKGTGLGLMVSYKIVDNHQGNIQVHSKPGEGATFEIRFPYRCPEDNGTSPERMADAKSGLKPA